MASPQVAGADTLTKSRFRGYIDSSFFNVNEQKGAVLDPERQEIDVLCLGSLETHFLYRSSYFVQEEEGWPHEDGVKWLAILLEPKECGALFSVRQAMFRAVERVRDHKGWWTVVEVLEVGTTTEACSRGGGILTIVFKVKENPGNPSVQQEDGDLVLISAPSKVYRFSTKGGRR